MVTPYECSIVTSYPFQNTIQCPPNAWKNTELKHRYNYTELNQIKSIISEFELMPLSLHLITKFHSAKLLIQIFTC
jgi:hypothetical protein